ncbi:hypothetical protein ABS315_22310 [Peribacillus frigoritolerans]|uniref:hypothetical protein n=1 Tax=Peribacillus frigoritolerans TaxID=450367 RepID=UPI0034E08FAC
MRSTTIPIAMHNLAFSFSIPIRLQQARNPIMAMEEAKITAYGSHALDEDALQTEYQYATSDAVGPIAHKKTGDNWFAVSFVDANNDIVYRKTIIQNGILSSVILTYPASKKANYDGLVTHVVSNFIPGKGEN